MLLEGVKINSDLDLTGRVTISEGVEPATGLSARGLPYTANAYVPRNPWRAVTAAEASLLFDGAENTPPSQCIFITRLPAEVAAPVRAVRLDTIQCREDLVQYNTRFPRLMGEVNKQLNGFAEEFMLRPDKKTGGNFALSHPGLATTSLNYASDAHVGLHLDNRDDMDMLDSAEATNRMCINLGNEDRYLLLVNQTVRAVYDRICAAKGGPQVHSHVFPGHRYCQPDLYQDFFALFPDYPVVRIRLGPDEAYIAPTENIIHDGSTLGKEEFDIVYYIRGFFATSSLAKAVEA